MSLPKEYEEDEVREGFYINGMMKKIWAAQIDALDFLNSYCKKHSIRWFMAYGTLLGAVRHQGYIPWDDDCDIWMLREDFNRLIKLLNNEKNCIYSICETRFENYSNTIPILTNNVRQISFENEFLANNHDMPYATTIDIFVLDYISRKREDEEWRDTAVRTALIVRALLDNLDTENEKLLDSNKIQGRSYLNVRDSESLQKNPREDIGHSITLNQLESGKDKFTSYQKVLNELENLILLTNHNFCKTEPLLAQVNLVYTGLISFFREDEADKVSLYPHHLSENYPLLDKHFFDKTVELPFEGRNYPAPSAYDQLLQSRYGNYMKKVMGDSAHTYPFFTEYEKEILGSVNNEINPYHFELNKGEIPDRSKQFKSPKESIRELLFDMTRLQEMVDCHLTAMNASNISSIYSNLQNAAVAIGNQIEESRTPNHSCIPYIQGYCEQVYLCFERLTKGKLTQEDLDKQHESFQTMKDQIESDYLNRKEILILIDRQKNWKAVASLWKVFSDDASCDVYVMMMPYYYKNADSSLKQEKQIDCANFQEQVSVVKEESYSIALRHPDLIFTVNGYDYYNYIRSVSPEFYTRILWKLTDQLIYIPWFQIGAFKKTDPQWATVPFFAQIPGILYADRTVVQSESVRNLYIKAAEEMDTSIPESYWQEKIVSWGSPLMDSNDHLDSSENIYQNLIQAMETSYNNR